MHILTIQKGFEAFKCKFEPFNKDSNIRIQIRMNRKELEAFENYSKHSKSNSNHSKGIRSIQMEMLTTLKVLEAF